MKLVSIILTSPAVGRLQPLAPTAKDGVGEATAAAAPTADLTTSRRRMFARSSAASR
jgi:hypothetical protein